MGVTAMTPRETFFHHLTDEFPKAVKDAVLDHFWLAVYTVSIATIINIVYWGGSLLGWYG